LRYKKLSNGETYAYREVGSGPQVLVLVHGMLSSSLAFTQLATTLSSSFRVIAPDMRGFGHTTYNKVAETHEDISDDIKLLIDELKISKCSVLGWSTGGPVAFYLAIKNPQIVEKLILFASVGPQGLQMNKWDMIKVKPTKETITRKEDLLTHCVPVVATINALKEKNKDFLRVFYDKALFRYKKPAEKAYEAILDEVFLQRNYLEMMTANMMFNVTNKDNGISKGNNDVTKLKAKTLIIHGDEDILCSVKDAKLWKECLGELATLKVLNKCGHNPVTEYPEDVVNLIQNFVASSGIYPKL